MATIYVYGTPILNSDATKDSAYCNAIVHRVEGQNLGELGMYGYDNACFWFEKTGYHPLFPEVQKKCIEILNELKKRNTYSNLKDIEISSDNWNQTILRFCAERQ